MRAAVKSVVDLAAPKNIATMINISTNLDRVALADDIVEEVAWLWENGVGAVLIPYPTNVIQWFYERANSLIRDRLT